MKKVYTKNFEHKGQMINYYNKVIKNEKITSACCYFGKNGYTVEYSYK